MLKLYNTALYSNTLPSQGRAEEEFYATERVSSRIGGGMANALVDPLNSALPHLSKHDYTAIAADIKEMMMRSIACTDIPGQYVSMEPRLNTIEESMGWLNPEENRYIYHSDHLGSSAFLTDALGTPTQHLQYLPFGENFIEQRTTTDYYSPYTFSAKERDLETGYSYFGARYYDADISVWLSVDPMAGKYPIMSPYTYCANNPIILRDPDGRVIEIVCLSTGARATYTPGMKVPEGSSKFVSDAITGLNFLHVNPQGDNNRVAQIASSDISVSLEQAPQGESSTYSGTTRTLRWDNQSADVYDSGSQSPIIGLAHEIDHTAKSVAAWEAIYSLEDMGDRSSNAYNQSCRVAYMQSDDPIAPMWEESAMKYESFIGDMSVDGKKLSTYKRTEYIPPIKQIKVESIFSIE